MSHRKERRITVGLVMAFTVLVFAALLLLGAAEEQAKATLLVEKSRNLLTRVDHVVMYLSDAENGRRGYVLSGQERYLIHLTNGLHRVEAALTELRRLAADHPDHLVSCDELERLIRQRKEILLESVRLRREEGLNLETQLALTERGQEAMEPVRQLAARMQEQETVRLDEQRAAREQYIEGAKGLAVLVTLVGLAVFSLLLILLVGAHRSRRQAEEMMRQANQELELRVARRTAELSAANDAVRRANETLEQRIRERTAQLEEANHELESFSYSVSHDLRAPLRHIQGYAEMLARAADGRLSEKADRFLQTIISAGRELGQLIDDLLDFSRASRTELRFRNVSLDHLVRDVLAGLELSTADRKIEWRISRLPLVHGDPTVLRQVFANLIGNAVKYTNRREHATIEVGSFAGEEGMAGVFVRDNGAGFDMKYADKLFGVFQRLHRSDEFEGTGIGLATVRRIVARHGGRTWAEGAVDQGATFYFTLKPTPANPEPAKGNDGIPETNSPGG